MPCIATTLTARPLLRTVPHGNGRNISDTPRMAQFVTMNPPSPEGFGEEELANRVRQWRREERNGMTGKGVSLTMILLNKLGCILAKVPAMMAWVVRTGGGFDGWVWAGGVGDARGGADDAGETAAGGPALGGTVIRIHVMMS